jgi:hypothetical protein
MEISHSILIEIFESQQNMEINYSLKRIPITFKWVLKIKTKLDGIIDNFITRFVAKGFSQIHGVDYTKKNSFVIKLNSIKVCSPLLSNMT